MAALLPVMACSPSPRKDAPDAATAPAATPQVLIQTSDGRTLSVKVELARTDAERQRGLMFRRSLEPDTGMLFFFDETSEHAFWMKNTLIPLDMIFIDETGRITGIVERAEPETTRPRNGGPSRLVLEVIGGYCAGHGVRAGDRVTLSR